MALCRVCSLTWKVTDKLQVHAGGGLTVIPPNIWQDNFLTGSTPFVVYPRLTAAKGAPIQYGFQITPAQLPGVYTPGGSRISFRATRRRKFRQNTVMDVDRYQKDVAALTPSGAISPLNLSAIDPSFGNAWLYTWTLGRGTRVRQADGGHQLRGHDRFPSAAHELSECLSGSERRVRASHAVRQLGQRDRRIRRRERDYGHGAFDV